jgi:VacB/RNase II family 3'-5' exoribonuclease
MATRLSRVNLRELAHQAMLDNDLLPEFSPEVMLEVEAIDGPAGHASGVRDLRQLLWASIDNDDSRDLDQLTFAEQDGDGRARVYVAIADVAALVPKDSAIDHHAQHNTTSVYVPGRVFSMLPERLSTDFTSLNPDEDRMAMVSEMIVAEGDVVECKVYAALVHNHAKLAYNSVDAWLDGKSEEPEAMKQVPGMAETIRLQNDIAQTLRSRRDERGALGLRTIEAKAVMSDGDVIDLREEMKNEPKELIEDFMIATNGATAKFLRDHRLPAISRIVRVPSRWDRIIKVAAEYGEKLPDAPDPRALDRFLKRMRKEDPVRFPDLSLTIIKLLGKGEYVVTLPQRSPEGHFGLAVRNYTHSTAPNRRYADLITQRMVKAALAGEPSPYTEDELHALATRCTEKEDDADKVERQMGKAAAAMLLQGREGQKFDGIVTGASAKGTWVRIFHPPVEGKVVRGAKGLDVGDRVRVKLVGTNPERGFIDFSRIHR